VAGEMAFDFSLSIFPAALFLAALVGPMGITPEHVSQALNVLGIFLHEMVREMVEENVRNLVAAQSQKVLTIGLLGAVWASSSAISATIKALNRANGVREARAFWYRRLLSVGLVLSGGVGLIVSFNLLIMGTWIEEELLARLGFGVPLTITILKWPVGFLGAVVMACLLYRIAPNCQPRLRELLPGSLLFAFLWFFLSKGFGYYVGHFSYYNKVYGILGGFIALLVWIYLTALILLIGGELNAELARGKKAAAEAPS
jgi:membrane protein